MTTLAELLTLELKGYKEYYSNIEYNTLSEDKMSSQFCELADYYFCAWTKHRVYFSIEVLSDNGLYITQVVSAPRNY